MQIPLYQVDAFTTRRFGGNPAAVCPLDDWLEDPLMQSIAEENNLAETAFFVPEKNGYRLRWFTPTTEVDLCGHATLASAYVIMNHLNGGNGQVRFETRSGELVVTREKDVYSLDFPAMPPSPCEVPEGLIQALGEDPEEIWAARDYMVVYEAEEQVRYLTPDLAALAELDKFAVIVTAPGNTVDFVSRFFAPSRGVPEDPATGSAHCTLIPYWSDALDKQKLIAQQLSKRVGDFLCEDHGDRVKISGGAMLFSIGTIHI